MKKKRFSIEQITAVLQQAETGIPVNELCRQVGVSEQTFYRWKKVYGGLAPSEARELKQLRDENTKLKRVVAEEIMDLVSAALAARAKDASRDLVGAPRRRPS